MATGRHSTSGTTRINRDLLLRQSASRDGGALIAQRGVARNLYLQQFEDFVGKSSQTLHLPYVATKVGTSTNNVVDFVSSSLDGQYKLLHSSDSEAQTMRLDWGDSLEINASKQPRMECRLKLNTNGTTLTADQRVVVGFASAYNATLDSVVTNAWFRIEGASLAIKVEGDDGTTDTDDQATGISYVKDTFLVLEVDIDSALVAHFLVDGVSAGQVSLAALAANTGLQPIIAIQRDAGAETEQLTVDYVDITWSRA